MLCVRFGIFRLTDPGGLQVILDCTAKEAFHPHPEVPIYTVRKAVLLERWSVTFAVPGL